MDNSVAITSSDYLSFVGYRITDATTVAGAFGFTDGEAATTCALNVAIMLDRKEDPTAMLAGDWASRQAALRDPDLWKKYGADPATYASVQQKLIDAGLTLIPNNADGNDGFYTSTVENRTIWVQLNSAAEFNKLFGAGPNDHVLRYSASADLHFWEDELKLPEDWGVAGLWFDNTKAPPPSDLTTDAGLILPDGPQSPGNSGVHVRLPPQQIAAFYDFPLSGLDVATGTIGLIEPSIGSYLSRDDPLGIHFQAKLDAYRADVGASGSGQVSVQGINGQVMASGERSLDVGVVGTINPNSDIQLFNGSGATYRNAGSTIFTAVQASIWNPVDGVLPEVTSSSFDEGIVPAPGSPYYEAYWQLYIDAALKNQTTVVAAGDGGSSGLIANGLTNVRDSPKTQAWNLVVGGTSLSTQAVAATDATLVDIYALAVNGDRAVLAQMVRGGLKTLPSASSDIDQFIETVWNQYEVSNTAHTISGYSSNKAGGGGVDVTQPTPSYQEQYGLTPVNRDSPAQTGRGVPDVSGNAGGNMYYYVPIADFSSREGDGGTSASSPLWASLIAQFNYIFDDQGLPDLGFSNDLFYIASAIAPGSFNDITIGRNNSAYYHDRDGNYSIDGTRGWAMDVGYAAGNDYDYVTGLGTPNGLLLGRALTAIAHAQTSFGNEPAILDADGGGGWTSGADQTLLFQTVASAPVAIGIDVGSDGMDYLSGATQSLAWTTRLAQQALQSDFDPNLVRLFDKAGQGAIIDSFAGSGDSLSVSLDGRTGTGGQAELTSDYGFVDFAHDGSGVRVARAVAVAETAGGADDQMAVVRLRQNGQDNIAVSFYRVDDLAGTIGGLIPGQAGYADAAQAAAYQLATGGTVLHGPGYGNYAQNLLLDVDAGDFIAIALVNMSQGQTYWAFSQANPDGQAHLWNYGLNTWGWEDTLNGGDRDFNDLIVQLDFTSTSGGSLLV